MKKLLKKKKQITRSIEGYTKFMQKKTNSLQIKEVETYYERSST